MQRVIWLVAALMAGLSQSVSTLRGEDRGIASGVLLPLTGASLATSYSGTLSFANSQGWYGFDVLKNGSKMHIEATAICTATAGRCTAGGTQIYFKYNTTLISPWKTTACLIDGMTAVTVLTASTGGPLTDINDVSW